MFAQARRPRLCAPSARPASNTRRSTCLRFASTHTDSADQTVSFTDYTARMKEGQDKIHYVTADDYNAAENSPHPEIYPLVTLLKYEDAANPRIADWSHIRFDQTMLAEGGSLADRAAFVKRLNEMLLAKAPGKRRR